MLADAPCRAPLGGYLEAVKRSSRRPVPPNFGPVAEAAKIAGKSQCGTLGHSVSHCTRYATQMTSEMTGPQYADYARSIRGGAG
jgi:hypothetical protein